MNKTDQVQVESTAGNTSTNNLEYFSKVDNNKNPENIIFKHLRKKVLLDHGTMFPQHIPDKDKNDEINTDKEIPKTLDIADEYIKNPKLIYTNWFLPSPLDKSNLFKALSSLTNSEINKSKITAIAKYFESLIKGRNGDANGDGEINSQDVIKVWKDS